MDAQWFEDNRGIKPDTLDAWGVTFHEGTAIFPYPSGRRYRKVKDDGSRVFLWDTGATVSLFTSPEMADSSEDVGAVGTAFILEGETDTMRLWQELQGSSAPPAHTYGLPGITSWHPAMADSLEQYQNIYVVLDNDTDYNVQATVDKSYKKIRSSLGPRCKRVFLPPGTKDVCEFFDQYDVNTLVGLVKKSSTRSRFQPLDLGKKPPPMRWLVEDFIASGDVTLVMGNPGIGKSMITMGLAVAVADGHSSWLGHKMHANNNGVLYIDEENPIDIIYHRLKKLGLKNKANVRYIHRAGIWLDRDPDELLDEAVAFNPSLIVLDSLARLHSSDENSAAEMSRLFRTGIVPLARDTGAAVIVIHHAIKSESSNSFVRARGSGDISAAVDAGIDVRPTSRPGEVTVSLYKSRRNIGGQYFTVKIIDKNPDEIVLDTFYSPIEEAF